MTRALSFIDILQPLAHLSCEHWIFFPLGVPPRNNRSGRDTIFDTAPARCTQSKTLASLALCLKLTHKMLFVRRFLDTFSLLKSARGPY